MRKILGIISMILLVVILVACGGKTFTVTWESNGGTGIPNIQANDGSTIDEPVEPTRSGYIFDGWYQDATFETIWDFDNDTVTSDITLYAKWVVSGPTDQDLVDDAYDWLSIGDLSALTQSSPRLILPTSRETVTITWVIDKLEYIAANGVITQPTFEDGNQTVTLTATLTLNAVTRTKVFTATVIALPSVENTPPIINETFKDYVAGNILTQTSIWGPVSGKTGNSLFTVVTSIPGSTIPKSSNALKIEALKELQVETPIVHSYDLLVIEVDLMQSNTSDASAINIQSSSSSPVVAFGLDGASLFYRTDNGTLMKTTIQTNQWYTMRVEINLVNKTMEAFYYENRQLISLTPGPVTYVGTTPLQSLFIRSGSSTTEVLRNPAYITNIVANRIEALPRPAEIVKLGEVTGIESTLSIAQNETFTPSVPQIYNYYGSQELLVKDTDYSLTITNPVDTSVPGEYVVTYLFTNLDTPTDTKTVTQNVTVYAVGDPNEITGVTSTEVGYLEQMTDVTVTVVQPDGMLYYRFSNNATEDKAFIIGGTSVVITSVSLLLDDLEAGSFTHIHFIVDHFGDSNIFSHALSHEVVTLISTPAEFMQAFAVAPGTVDILGRYALTSDIDLNGLTWTDQNASFKGVLYGNGYTVKNLTMTKTGTNYGGLFARANGAIIRDLVLDHIMVTSADRGGILVGRIENGDTVITNVVIMNSSITGANSNGVGGVIGLVSRLTTLSNVAIIDSTVTANGQKNVGGIVGRVDNATLIANDIYVRGVTVTSTVLGEAVLDVAAGGLVGYVRDSLTSIITANRVVIIDTNIHAIVGGALIGYLRNPGSATVQNAYVEVNFTHEAINAAGLVGRVNNETDKLNETSIFGSLSNAKAHAQTQDLTNNAVPTNQAWWSTNLPVFVGHELWTFDTNAIFALNNYLASSKPMVNVTLDYNITLDDEVIQIREGQTFVYSAPLVVGYNFMGWFTDAEMTQAVIVLTITTPVTLYGKYVAIPTYDVLFESNGGSLVTSILDVYENEMILEPADPVRSGFIFQGWYKDALFAEAWVFATDTVTADITLYAKWEEIPPVTYTVSFETNGGSIVDPLLLVAENALITAPTSPTKDGYTFEGWFKDEGLLNAWVFETDVVVANITLYAKWALIPVTYTVTFESNGGSAVTAITGISDGALISAPAAPTKTGFDFAGWYHDVELTNDWVFETDLVTANITLYAKWTEKLPTPISTAQEFYDMTISGSSEKFVLVNSIDFTGFAWVETGTGTAFRGTLDGAGFTISNITITGSGTGVYGGIFQRVNGATIKNLIINNANVDVVGRAGILLGRIENNAATFMNITISNSSVKGTDSNGVGIFMGNASLGFTATNIRILSSTAYSTAKNVGGMAGRADNLSQMTDIYIFGITVETTQTTTDSGVSSFIGYTNHADANVIINRAVVEATTLKSRSAGTLIGYHKLGNLSATDVFTDVTFVYGGSAQHGIIGRKDSVNADVIVRVFAHYIGQQVGAAIQLPAENVLANLDGLNQAWWETNLPNIHGNSAWTYDAVSKFYELN